MIFFIQVLLLVIVLLLVSLYVNFVRYRPTLSRAWEEEDWTTERDREEETEEIRFVDKGV